MIKKYICRVFLCLMILALMPVQAHAIDRIDLSHPVHLTINFTHEGQPLPGAEFEIHKVAELDERGNYTFVEPYAGYPVDFSTAEANWAALANTLNSYIQADKVAPTDAGITDADGKLQFPVAGKPMEPGIYLISGKTLTYNDMCYTPAPTLIALPNREGDSHQWIYDVSINAKYTFRSAPVDCKVVKVWNDDSHESERPDFVKVNLLRDGQIVDTVKLSRENNWTHQWTNLEREYSWTVTEVANKGYTVSITQDNTSFTVTNTFIKKDEKLPQTGSLWWPVPVMIIAGLGCIIAGLWRKKGMKNEA